jgi:hypothetical protein
MFLSLHYDTYLRGLREMLHEILGMLTYGDDLRIHVVLQRPKRFGGVLGVPYGTGRHTKYLRTKARLSLEILLHDPVVGVVLPTMVTLIEYHEGQLSRRFIYIELT